MTISDNFKILGSFLDITGSSDLSTDYSLKIDKASGIAILYVRNDGIILINSTYNNAQLNVKTSPSPLYVNGVFGDASASNGFGVYGVGTYGVVGYTATAAYGNAIYGNASSIPYTGVGGYFVGGVTAIVGKSSTSDLNSSILQLMDSGSNVKMNVLGSGYTSIGLTTPTATLHLKGIDSTSSNYSLKVDNLSGNSILHVRNDGCVGIGGTSIYSTYTLQILANGVNKGLQLIIGGVGTAVLESDIDGTSGSLKLYNSALGYQAIQFNSLSNSYISNIYNFGIGTNAPTAKTHIVGISASSADYVLRLDNSSINLLSVANNGQAFFKSSLDGESSGVDNYSFKSTTGGLRTGYYSEPGLGSIFGFFQNNILKTQIYETGGSYAISVKNRFSLKTLADNKTHLYMASNGQIGIGGDFFVTDASLHVQGVDSTSANYALKVENLATTNLFSVRNDGLISTTNSTGGVFKIKNVFETDLYNTYLQIEPVVLSSNKFYVSTVGYGFWNYGSSNPNISPIDGTNLLYKNTGFEVVTYGSSSKFVRFNVTNPNSFIQYYAGYNDASFNFESDIFKFGKNGAYNFLQIDATNAGSGVTKMGLGALGVLSNITALLHLKGNDSTLANYALKVDNSSGSPLLYVRNDGNVCVGTGSSMSYKFQVGNDLDGNGISLSTTANQPLVLLGKNTNSIPTGYLGIYDTNGNVKVALSSNQYSLSDFINTGLNFGIGSSFTVVTGATAKLHVQGVSSTSADFALKVDNSASTPLLYVRNDGFVSINQTSIGAARLEITGGSFQGAYVQSSGSIAVNGVDPIGLAIKGETSTGTALFAKITNGSGTSGIAIRAHDQSGNIIFTVNGDGNIGFNGTSFGGGAKVIFNAFATTIPTTNPTAGVIDYIENTGGGVHKYRDTNGTIIAY